MSLEGTLRELGLPEVLQLLGLTRKTGTLHLRAPLRGDAAFVRMNQGAIVDAAVRKLTDLDGPKDGIGLATSAAAVRAVEACVLDLLTWTDGDFRFTPVEAPVPHSPVRLTVEMLLVDAAQRAEGWERLADRIAHAHVVPTFVELEPQQLPLLRLVPQEWEILTRVDGQRDLSELAAVLGRELLDVAEIVHGLIGSGLLTLREAASAPRRNPTPPIGSAVQPASEPSLSNHLSADRWIPQVEDRQGEVADPGDDDSLFDPMLPGGPARDGLRGSRPTPTNTVAPYLRDTETSLEGVAPMAAETSLQRGETRSSLSGEDATMLCSQGDEAARRGDLAGALECWSAALRSEASLADADRIREAIALAARLHALLHPAARRA